VKKNNRSIQMKYIGENADIVNAHIGNYGSKLDEQESDSIQIAGLISKNFTDEYSRIMADSDLDEYFRERGIVSELKIAVLDFGTKRNILDCMKDRGARLKVFPAKTAFEELREFAPDGYFLSNGPGDPAAMDYAIETTKSILETGKPVFGICLGHQILALANGIPTYKMHHGHRGINHPVINLESGKCEITSQNHGFGVSPEAIANAAEFIEVTHKNLNDSTIEGIRVKGKNAFSVQYHPEASPGPHDSRYLFDQFIELVKQNK